MVYAAVSKLHTRNDVSGETFFTAISSQRFLCYGIIPVLPSFTPCELSGVWDTYKGKPIFRVSSFRVTAHSTEDALRFLKALPHMGEVRAKKLIDAIGADVFAYISAHANAAECLKDIGLSESNAEEVVKQIRDLVVVTEVYARISAFGGTLMHAYALNHRFGIQAMEVMTVHPYRTVYSGLPFHVAEKISAHILPYDEERVDALLYTAFRLGEGSGNTCFTFMEISRLAGFVEKKAGQKRTSVLFLGAGIVRNKDYYVQIEQAGQLLFARTSIYRDEKNAAMDLARLVRTRVQFPCGSVSVQEVEEECNVTYGTQQKEAFALFAESGVKILTGGPGTGKTTTVNGLIRYYRKMFSENKIVLCAPTANAAKRLMDSTGMKAETVHRLLGLRPLGDRTVADKDRYAKLDADLLIADEVSMLDEYLVQMLLAAMPDGSTILFVGDENQLASIGPGNVLHDLLQVPQFSCCRLTDVYRQAASSSIVANSRKIQDGIHDLIQDAQTEVHIYQDGNKLAKEAIRMLQESYRKGEQAVVLTPVRSTKYETGTIMLNREAQRLLSTDGDKLFCGDYMFMSGDPIIMTRNNYKKGYINGDEGYVVRVSSERHCMLVNIDGTEISLRGQSLQDVDLNYAKTVHKSQGGEYDVCYIALASQPSNMLLKRMAYVAATRAKKRNVFLIQNDALDVSLSNTKERARRTLLKEFVEEEFREVF